MAKMTWDVARMPRDEGEERHRRLRAAMGEAGVDCLVVAGLNGNYGDRSGVFRWIANYAPWFDDEYIVFPREGEPTLFAWSSGHGDWARRVAWVSVRWPERGQRVESIVTAVREAGCAQGTIGVLLANTPAHIYQGLAAACPEARLVDVAPMFTRLRAVKSPLELGCMERSAWLGDQGVRAIVETMRPGVTDREIWAAMEDRMTRLGAQPPSFSLLTSFSRYVEKGQSIPYGPSDRVVRPNDGLIDEVTPSYMGYFTQVLRPVAVGRVDPMFAQVVDLHVRLYDVALQHIRPGVTVEDVEAHVREEAARSGCTGRVWSLQPIGLLVTDHLPADMRLEAGMTLVVHPQTQHEGDVGGHTLGDTVTVTADGCRRLSELPYDRILEAGRPL